MCYNGNSRKVHINLFKGSNRVTHITSKNCVVSFNAGHDRMKYCMCVEKGVHKSLTSEKQSAQL